MARQAETLVARAVVNDLDPNPGFTRWYTCNLCEQHHHGVVR
jgi:hypothetical protein